MSQNQRRKGSSSSRYGTTAVEFALSAPVLFLLVFGLIEFSRAYQIRAVCTTAAIAAAREARVEGATNLSVAEVAESLLQSLGITDFQVNVTPAVLGPAASSVNVSVEVPMNNANGLAFTSFFQGKSIRRVVTRDFST